MVFGDMSFSEPEEDSVITSDYKIDYKQCFVNDYLRKKRDRKPRMLAADYPAPIAVSSEPIRIPERQECHECSGLSKSYSPVQHLLAYSLSVSPKSSFLNHTFTNNCFLASGLRDYSPTSPRSWEPEVAGASGRSFGVAREIRRESEPTNEELEDDDVFAGSIVVEMG
jgi:hypothetical protein